MVKYYCEYDNSMEIKELNEIGQNNRYEYEKRRNTYNSLKLYNSIKEAIKSLNGYSKDVRLPSGKIIVPAIINYPELESEYILKRVIFPIFEY